MRWVMRLLTLLRRVRAAGQVLAGERPARVFLDEEKEWYHAEACARAGVSGIMTDVLRFPEGPDGEKAAAITRECVYRHVRQAIAAYRMSEPEKQGQGPAANVAPSRACPRK